MTKVTIQDLMDSGVHFGHQTKRWNPKMKKYIYGARNGIYIFDLTKTMHLLEHACQFVYQTVLSGGEVLFVGTKRQAQELIRTAAESTEMHYMCERWLGGTLTNNQTIRKSISQMEEIMQVEESGEIEKMPKKEAASSRRKLSKLQRYLSGIASMRKMPKALVVVDVDYEDISVREAKRLGIPVVGIVDTNCNPDDIDFVIPGNDDAQRAIKVIIEALSFTIKAARESYLQTIQTEEPESATIAEEKEITQSPVDDPSQNEVSNEGEDIAQDTKIGDDTLGKVSEDLSKVPKDEIPVSQENGESPVEGGKDSATK